GPGGIQGSSGTRRHPVRVRVRSRARLCHQAGRDGARQRNRRWTFGPRRQRRKSGAGAAEAVRMSRYAAMFERLDGQGAFGACLMLGDPHLVASAALLNALVEGGADMIEVGIPFSDPVADGPVIQAAAQRAL